MNASTYVIRRATDADEPFLREMLVVAAFRPGTVTPPPDQVYRDEHVARYLSAWGRRGDAGMLAEANRLPIGAAWYRCFTSDRPGYGFVSQDMPELAIAVVAGWRGRGVGRALLGALIDHARREGHPGLSLSISRRNAAALRLYRSLGFEEVAGEAEHPTMLLRLRS